MIIFYTISYYNRCYLTNTKNKNLHSHTTMEIFTTLSYGKLLSRKIKATYARITIDVPELVVKLMRGYALGI